MMNQAGPSAPTRRDEVVALYRTLLRRTPEPAGLEHYLGLLRQGWTLAQISRDIKNSSEYRRRRFPSPVLAQSEENARRLDAEIRTGQALLRSRPYTFNVDLIGLCNMQPPCSMCINWKDGRSPRHHRGISAADLRAFGEHLQLSGEIINCGIGEPLLNRDLPEILDLFHSWGKPFGFNSNGLALTPALVGRLEPYFEILSVMFSVDAASAATYAKVRGVHFQKVVDQIAHYCRRRREAIPEGAASLTGMVMMPMRCNRHEVADFVRLAARLGVDKVELRALNAIDCEWRVQRGDFLFDYRREMLSRDELEQARQEAVAAAAECGIELECQYLAAPEATFAYFKPPEYRDLKLRCVLPWRFILPYQNGDTLGCCFMTESLGDWRRQGLEALWNGPRMQALRRQMAEGQLPDECYRYRSCPVVQEALAASAPAPDLSSPDRTEDARLAAIRHLIATPSLAVTVPKKLKWLAPLVSRLRGRFARETEHCLRPLIDNQRRINLELLREIAELRDLLRRKGDD